jgi:hypothetical protein
MAADRDVGWGAGSTAWGGADDYNSSGLFGDDVGFNAEHGVARVPCLARGNRPSAG